MLNAKRITVRVTFFAILFILSCLFFYCDSYAAPCYGTKLPTQGKFFAGFSNYSIFKRDLEDDFGKLRSVQNFFQLSYGVWDWLSLDLKGGAGNIKQHPADSFERDYSASFAGGYGFRAKFYDRNKIKMVFGFQHISVHPRSIRVENNKNKAILDDWQVSLLASYDFVKFTPYLGTRWSRLDYIHWVEEDRKRIMSDSGKDIGFICGIDVPLFKNTWLNVEGQFFDAEALATSINFAF